MVTALSNGYKSQRINNFEIFIIIDVFLFINNRVVFLTFDRKESSFLFNLCGVSNIVSVSIVLLVFLIKVQQQNINPTRLFTTYQHIHIFTKIYSQCIMILTFNSSPSLRRDLSDDLVTIRPCNFLLILAKSLSKTRDTLQYVDKETVSSAEASSMVHLWTSSELVNNQKRH